MSRSHTLPPLSAFPLLCSLLFSVGVIGCSREGGNSGPSAVPQTDSGQPSTGPSGGKPASGSASLPTEFSGQVASVVTGDQIVVSSEGRKIRIRLHGVAAPKAGQPRAAEAKQTCAEMCRGKTVSVKAHGKAADGTVHGEVALPGGKSLNRALVWCGAAWWDRQAAPHDHQLKNCETDARKAKRGLWTQTNPVPPWKVASKPPTKPSKAAPPPTPPPPPKVSGSGGKANFSGKWLCKHGKDTIPGALTQRGNRLTGYCIYPGNHRATFSGTVNGNRYSGTLDVPHQKRQWKIEATLNGDTMTGTWGGKNKWTAHRR